MSWGIKFNWSGFAKRIFGVKSSPEQQGNLELTEEGKKVLKSFIKFDQEDYVNSVTDSLKGKFAEAFNGEEMKNKIINDTTDAIYKDLSVLLEDSLKSEIAEGVVIKLSGETHDESIEVNGTDESAVSGSGDVQELNIF